MDLAKSLFAFKVRDGYAGKEDKIQVETATSDDEENTSNTYPVITDDYECTSVNDVDLLSVYQPIPGGPFSAVTPSMWPQDVLLLSKQDDPDFRYDEFGFQCEEIQNESHRNNKLNEESYVEDSQNRLQWLAQLEFSQGDDLTWENVSMTLPRTDKLGEMVKEGIPHSLRAQLWMRFSGALAKKNSAEMNYRDIVKSSNFDHLVSSQQIEKDVLRTLPGNACFSHKSSTGVPRLRRILRAITWFFPDIGYCQGMGVIVAHLLLLMEEEDAFWTMVTIMEDLLPASYYVNGLTGVMADIRVLRNLIPLYLPGVHETFVKHDVDITLTGTSWLLPIFANVFHIKLLFRIWDLFFFYGSITLFRVALAVLKLIEPKIVDTDNIVVIYNTLNDAPGEIDDVRSLLQIVFNVCTTLTESIIDNYRRKHQAYIMVDRGTLIGDPEAVSNLPKQHLTRRQIKKSKSMIQLILFGDELTEDEIKNKNIKQTELLVDLRDAIMQIAHHFISVDPKLSNVSLVPDYSIESHTKDHENYNIVSRSRRRRAKALLDFERHDDDELGFRKNDIITVISQKDEHCWVGELNGLRGWFPAKFVELLDERSKQYSSAGDDSVMEVVTDLVRGTLCPAIKQILEHGMRRPSFLGGPCHPWLFIEDAAVREVEKDFTSVHSRLMLCKTYRLDEDGKVLTPEEVLYRCIQSVNQSHDDAHVQMDVKLRSLICLGLNEQVLHLWLEVLCSCVEVVHKWYHPWSFVCSPGWVQIKCELRILSQFPFNLNPDFELPPRREKSQPLKDGVRDMLVKHHLFSWDL